MISSFAHEFSANGRITALNRQLSPGASQQRYEYGYDSVDQLTSATLTEVGNNQLIESYQYRYDLAGNRLSSQKGSALSSGQHDIANQLTEQSPGGTTRVQGSVNRATSSITLDGEEAAVLPDGRFFVDADLAPGNNELPLVVEEADGTITNKTLQVQITDGERLLHEYDLNGNLIKTDRWDTATNSSLPHRRYSWDAVNRLLSITRYEGADELRTEFGYNIANQRVERKEYTNTTQTEHVRYIWNEHRVRQRRDASGANVQITYCGNGELDVSSGGLKRFYTRDHLGSVRNVMDASGNEIASYDYSPFGVREAISGTYEAEIGYTGHHYHIGSGLVLTLYRAYDPVTGRWLSPDPLGEAGGVNLYQYVLNSPLLLWDPDGLTPAPVVGAIIGGLIGGVAGGLTSDCDSGSDGFLKDVAKGALGGIAGGAVFGATFNPSAAGAVAGAASGIIAGGLSGAASGAVGVGFDALDPCAEANPWDIPKSALYGAVGGFALGGIGGLANGSLGPVRGFLVDGLLNYNYNVLVATGEAISDI